jgi:PAS domain S-box-containing protein
LLNSQNRERSGAKIPAIESDSLPWGNRNMPRSNRLLWLEPAAIRSYGIAVLSVAAAMIVLRWPPLHLQQAPASLFLCAILLSSWFGGAKPGLLATTLSVLAYYYLLPPIGSLGPKPEELPRLFIFVATALFVWLLSAAQRRATESLRRTRDQLHLKIQETQATNVALQAESRERLQIENVLRHSEAYLAEAQRLSHTGSFGWKPSTMEIFWSEETFLIFRYDRTTKPTVELILHRVHPDDVASVQQTVERAMSDGKDFDHEYRLAMPDGAVKHVHVVAHAERAESGELEFVGAVMDTTESKRVEKELRRSEGYLAEAQRLSHTGSWASTPAMGEIRYLSEECYRVLGFDPGGAQPRYKEFFERIHPDDQDKVREAVETAGRENKEFDLDYRIVHPGGDVRDIHVVGHPVFSPSGDLVEYVGTVIDITERKQAEDRTRLIIDTVPAQLWTESPDGVVDFVNRRWIDYTGMTLEQAVGSGWNQMVHPDDIERVLSKWRTLIAEGKPREIESRLRRSDGTYRWFLSRCYPLIDPSGHTLGWYGTDTDIHDRKEAEETLRRSEGYLAEAQRLSHTGSWAWAPATADITYLSEECYRVLGFDPHEGLPRVETFFQRIHPKDQARSVEQFEKASREKTEFEFDYRIVHPGGNVRDIHTVGHPVLSPSGDLVEFVGTVIDITERKLAEEERERLRQAQADIAHANRVTTMGELTASVAHEVNQPIAAAVTSANSCIHWLAADIPNLEKARTAAMRIVKDATRAAEIITRTRLLFQKGAAQQELVDVNEVIEEMTVLLRGEITRYSLSVRTELAPDLPPVLGDRVQLQQVLMNLMVNSIDAMKNVDGVRELAIKSQRAENEQLLVSVSDTGVGLPPGQADQIFNAFFTTKPHGTGMGLRICRSIVESHGGRLWVDNNALRGATFCVSLPGRVEAPA